MRVHGFQTNSKWTALAVMSESSIILSTPLLIIAVQLEVCWQIVYY